MCPHAPQHAIHSHPVAAFAEAATGYPQFFPGGQLPALVNPRLAERTTVLCNDAYAVLASGVTHGALWSAEHLTAAGIKAVHGTPCQNTFHPDKRLPPADQARLDDYSRSGFDRGHMTPSGDVPTAQTQQQSFSLANMVPQTAALNRGLWAAIETAVRKPAVRRGELYLVTGPAFVGEQIATIGPDGVLVPSATWKAVYDPRARAAGAYVCANTAAPTCEVAPVAALVRLAGSDPFPALPAGLKETAMTLPAPAHGGRSTGSRRQPRREPVGLLEHLPSHPERL